MATVYETTPFQHFASAASGTTVTDPRAEMGYFGLADGFGPLGSTLGGLGCPNQGFIRQDGVGSIGMLVESPLIAYSLFALGAAGLAGAIAYSVKKKPGRKGPIVQSAVYQGGAVAALIGAAGGGGLSLGERAFFGGAGLALLVGGAYTATRRG